MNINLKKKKNMAKKINDITLSRLLVATHYEYHIGTYTLISKATPAALMIEDLAPKYKTEIDTLFEVINRQQGSVLTKQLEEIDHERDLLLGEINTIVNHAVISPMPDRKAAGEQLKRVLAPYKGISSNEMNKETAQLTGLLRDLGQDENVDAIDALTLGPMISALKKANNLFRITIEERSELYGTRAASVDVNTDQQRKAVDELYRAITEKVNAVAILQPTDVVNTFIDQVNGRIIEYKKVLSQMRAGGTGTEKGTGGKTEPETPETPDEE